MTRSWRVGPLALLLCCLATPPAALPAGLEAIKGLSADVETSALAGLGACFLDEATTEACMKQLSSAGLSMFWATRELVHSCGDENPMLQLLAEPERLPLGRNRNLLLGRLGRTKAENVQLPVVELAAEAFALMRRYARVAWRLALDHSHTCLTSGRCDGQASAAEALQLARLRFMKAAGALVGWSAELYPGGGVVGAAKAAGLGEVAASLARHAFSARHMDFGTSVLNGLREDMDPMQVMSLLHDLSMRVASANCELQSELLAHAALAELAEPGLVAEVGLPRLPRFEFHQGLCCRRYHVLKALLEPMVEQRRLDGMKPFRILEIGVNNAITSQYILEAFSDVEFDGVDPFIDAEPIFAEATERLRRFGQRARLWRETSEVAVPRFAPGSFDLVFIDGDHSRAGVTSDLGLWWDRVRPGGLLAGHDLFNLAFEGVLEALVVELGRAGGERPVVHFAADFVWWLQM